MTNPNLRGQVIQIKDKCGKFMLPLPHIAFPLTLDLKHGSHDQFTSKEMALNGTGLDFYKIQ